MSGSLLPMHIVGLHFLTSWGWMKPHMMSSHLENVTANISIFRDLASPSGSQPHLRYQCAPQSRQQGHKALLVEASGSPNTFLLSLARSVHLLVSREGLEGWPGCRASGPDAPTPAFCRCLRQVHGPGDSGGQNRKPPPHP